jgi:hypothetical protein
MTEYYASRKQGLMEKLNEGIFIPSDWVDFITDARADGMLAMADDMQRRYTHYMEMAVQEELDRR